MIIFEGDKEYKFRNLGSEVTLAEFDKVNQIFNPKSEIGKDEKDKPKLVKWLKVVALLGDKGLDDVIDTDSLLNMIKNFKATDIDADIIDSITIGKRTYELAKKEGKLYLSGKDTSTIEEFFRTKNNWVTYTIAILFKDVELSVKEHYDNAHLKYKAELFGKELTAEICAPIIYEVNKQIAQTYIQMSDIDAKS